MRTITTAEMRRIDHAVGDHDPLQATVACVVPYVRGDTVIWWKISIIRGLKVDEAIEALVHEWAHVLDRERHGDTAKEDHRDSWGKTYSKVYRCIYEGK